MKMLLSFTAAVLSCVAFAYASEPLPLTVVSEPVSHETTAHVTAVPVKVAAPYTAPVKVASAAPVKARKRICDDRGNTYMHGYARPVETRISNETIARVCWTE